MSEIELYEDELCPICHAKLSFIKDGETYSNVIGIVINDRVQNWRCPKCESNFPNRLIITRPQSLGTKIGAEIRAKCNKLTQAEREQALESALAVINQPQKGSSR